MTTPTKLITLSVDGQTPDGTIVALEGVEQLSNPYQFVLDLLSEDLNLAASDFIGKSAKVEIAALSINQESVTKEIVVLPLLGSVTSFVFLSITDKRALYRVTINPRLSYLSRSKQSRVFLNKSVREIVIEVLRTAGYADATIDFPSTLAATARDYVLQFEESDLAFISRWLEHEGVFYFFDHSGSSEKIRFGAGTAVYANARVSPTVEFRPTPQKTRKPAYDPTRLQIANEVEVEADGSQTEDWFGAEAVMAISLTQQVLPARVQLNEYNEETPGSSLVVSATVSATGLGTVYEHNNHYLTQSDGNTLAAIRVEEIKCREKIFSGASNCRAYSPGYKFELSQHPRSDFNMSYVLTGVKHRARQSQDSADGGLPSGSYANEFVAIPATVVFRPPRVTPWPRVPGVLHAKVDASGDGEYAELDGQGRYKVKLGLDMSTASGGTASKAVRMAQPYAGNEMGMHFPLHKGTEVVLTHLNGDPDRPIIQGAMSNPDTPSQVVDTNQSDARIKTGGGNEIVMEDYGHERRIWLHAGPGMIPPAASFSVGANAAALSTIDGMAHMVGSIGMISNTIIGAFAAMLGSSKQVVIFAGYYPLVMIMIALKFAQVAAFKAMREARRTNTWPVFWGLIFLPIMNSAVSAGIAALISNRMDAWKAWGLSNAGVTKRVHAAEDNRKWYIKGLSWLKGTVMELLKPAIFIADMIMTLSFQGAMTKMRNREDKALKKTLPAIQLIRSAGGTSIDLKDNGENILIATLDGSIDMACDDDFQIHAGKIHAMADTAYISGEGGAVDVEKNRVHLWGKDEQSEIMLDDKSLVLNMHYNIAKGKRHFVGLTKKGVTIGADKTLIGTHQLESTLQVSKDMVFLGNHGGSAPVTIGHGGMAISFINKAIVINNEKSGPVTIISNGKVCISGKTEVEIKSDKVTLKASNVKIDGGPGGVNITGALKVNGQDVSLIGPPAVVVPLPSVPLPLSAFHSAAVAKKAAAVATQMAASGGIKAAALIVDAAEIARQQEIDARRAEEEAALDDMFQSGNFGLANDSPIMQAARRGSSPFFE